MGNKPWTKVFIVCQDCNYYLRESQYINGEWICPECRSTNVNIYLRSLLQDIGVF